MKMFRPIAFVIVVAVFTLPILAGDPITIGERISISSNVLKEERFLLVSTPPGYDRSTQKYPVLYLTDGAAHFEHTRATVNYLAGNGLMPQLIVVGITNTDRTRDLTPTMGANNASDGTRADHPTAGGADRFLNFVANEVVPLIEINYRTEPYRIFCGHSFGGLFALHAMLEKPDLFNAIIAASPSLVWDNRLIARKALPFFKDREALKLSLFMTQGSEGRSNREALEQMRAILKHAKTKGVRWDIQTWEDEDHGSVVLRSHYHGLRMIFAGWRLPTDPQTGRFSGGLAELIRHFASLSERLGFTIKPPEAAINAIGYAHVQAGNVFEAIDLFRYNATAYPDSPNVYDSLGEALEKNGKLPEALQNYEKAASLGMAKSDPNLTAFIRNRDRIQKRLANKV